MRGEVGAFEVRQVRPEGGFAPSFLALFFDGQSKAAAAAAVPRGPSGKRCGQSSGRRVFDLSMAAGMRGMAESRRWSGWARSHIHSGSRHSSSRSECLIGASPSRSASAVTSLPSLRRLACAPFLSLPPSSPDGPTLDPVALTSLLLFCSSQLHQLPISGCPQQCCQRRSQQH